MKKLFSVSFILSFLMQVAAWAQLPSQPIAEDHPSNGKYSYSVQQDKLNINGRAVDVFFPAEALQQNSKRPVVVFGHGQAIGVEGYNQTFQHLARKGFVVIHPMYDDGFFDQEWRRMAQDFNNLAAAAMSKYDSIIDYKSVLYSGHSKGGYVALMAAATKVPDNKYVVGSLLLFAPAGYDAELIKWLDPDMPVTLIWSDADTIIKQSAVQEIYDKLEAQNKQLITVVSYADAKADHFFPLNKSYFFGGKNGISSFHYYVTWKYLGAALLDLQEGSPVTHPYLYGNKAASTGVDGLSHKILKNW